MINNKMESQTVYYLIVGGFLLLSIGGVIIFLNLPLENNLLTNIIYYGVLIVVAVILCLIILYLAIPEKKRIIKNKSKETNKSSTVEHLPKHDPDRRMRIELEVEKEKMIKAENTPCPKGLYNIRSVSNKPRGSSKGRGQKKALIKAIENDGIMSPKEKERLLGNLKKE